MPRRLLTSPTLPALGACLIVLAGIAVLTRVELRTARHARAWVTHTYEVVRGVTGLGEEVAAGDSALDGFLMGGDTAGLAAFNADEAQIPSRIQGLRALTADNPVQQDSLAALERLVAARRAALAALVGQAERNPAPLGREHPHAADQSNLAAIRARLAAMLAEEQRLLALRTAREAQAERLTGLLALGGAVSGLGLLAVCLWLLAGEKARLAKAEAAQRALAEELGTVFEGISQGIGVFGAEGGLRRWNGCFGELLQLPPGALHVGRPFAAVQMDASAGGAPLLDVAPEAAPAAGDDAWDCNTLTNERRRPSDGRSFEVRRTPLADSGFVITISDVTARVEATRAADETARLQAIGQLTGGIAHDFNNLLTVVLGNLELLRSRVEPDGAPRQMLERAAWAAERGAQLTRQLLAVARRQHLAPVPVDIGALLPDLAELLRRTLGQGVAVTLDMAPALWCAEADPGKVEAAILNLALNARDAMPGGGSLTLGARNVSVTRGNLPGTPDLAPGDYVLIEVRDTGEGMTEEVRQRAFEPFFTTKEVGRGTGLGLAMVYGFAKQSGGHAAIDSRPGDGTAVRIFLPRCAALPAVEPALPASASAGGTVLLVEDEPEVRRVVSALLAELGYTVLEAADAATALTRFEERRGEISLVLSDVALSGGVSGPALARQLWRLEPDLPVVFVSGHAEPAFGALDEAAARAPLIAKPFTRDLLARQLAAALAGRRGKAA